MAMTKTTKQRFGRKIMLQALVCLLAFASCDPAHHPNPSRTKQGHGRRVLRGLKNQEKLEKKQESEPKVPPEPKESESKSKKTPSPKQTQQPPEERANKNGNKKRVYQDYNFFVEACEEELVADVINGGIIQHSQYTNFIYGYCRDNEYHGRECTKEMQEKGFDGLSNDIKLLYIKSFCPEDVEGQVSCLHGMNDRGRKYEFNDELEKLCRDLEKLMIKNDLLEEQDKKNPIGDVADASMTLQEGTEDAQSDQQESEPAAALEDYQLDYNPIQDGYTVVQPTDYDSTTSSPFDLPTQFPTVEPTMAPTEKPIGSWARPGPSGSSGASSPATATTSTADTPVAIPIPSSTHPGVTFKPTVRPTPNTPELAVVDGNGNPINAFAADANGSDNTGLTGGAIVAIILIILLGIAIACVVSLVIRRRQLQNHRNIGMHREFFFMCMRREKRCDQTLEKDETFVENNGSIDSGEIDFHGPLFESWPAVSVIDRLERRSSKDDSSTGTLYNGSLEKGSNDENISQTYTSEGDPSTYKSSLLHSFFSKSADQRRGEDGELIPSENAVDEIRRAINNAQWQDVYYLASKMASEGNIDTKENLQSALVRTNEIGGDNAHQVSRAHLKPADATKASQLDVSLAVGDWITLAARAAVFAALESANNPVPSSISFIPGKENAEDCLAKAKAALEEVQKAAKSRRERLKQNPPLDEVEEITEERVVFVNADEAEDDDFEYQYPKEDYSDFSRSESREESPKHETNDDEDSDEESSPDVELLPLVLPETDFCESDEEESISNGSNLPGPPSIAMSNQSTIPTQPSSNEAVPFTTIEDGSRGPFRRDFANGISHPMEQVDEEEMPPTEKFRIKEPVEANENS